MKTDITPHNGVISVFERKRPLCGEECELGIALVCLRACVPACRDFPQCYQYLSSRGSAGVRGGLRVLR